MARNILDMALSYLVENGHYPASSIEAWFSEASLVRFEEGELVLCVPNDYKCGYVNQKFIDPLEDALYALTGEDIKVSAVMGESSPAQDTEFDDHYTFKSFIVGSSNKLAHAAALAVSKQPGKIYNPLFIYGNSGLGKTHLMHAIEESIAERFPAIRSVYVKGEDFTNEFITAVANGNTEAFREKYRQNDLLLLDDIQFIAGKERTQEEFFHTFNKLYEGKKQIVLTSDRPPKEIRTLEDRLCSRFEMGLIVDVQPPDYETRIAILRDKAVAMGLGMPDEVSEMIAERIRANVRQLEGIVKKMKAMRELADESINMETATRAMEALSHEDPNLNPTPQRILEAVSAYFYITVDQLLSQIRTKEVANARQIAMYMMRQELSLSFPDVAKLFSRDHTTVMHACRRIEEEKKADQQMADMLQKLHIMIRGEG